MAFARLKDSQESMFHICQPETSEEGCRPESAPGGEDWVAFWEATRATGKKTGNVSEHMLSVVTNGQVRVDGDGFGAAQKKCPVHLRIPCARNEEVIMPGEELVLCRSAADSIEEARGTASVRTGDTPKRRRLSAQGTD